ncbi:hypothetical protein B0J12DRAFT_707033 [Macrophomina phaseolina]|uniref:Uncharacterized protein n=1 Tax=Macrophomina phaseolina TaxID=35725 RepID=A0ABQ8GWI3_9PEZI|nr:hypothetical protein B0J12DRAFT_707033 [Macrophomina phaseolina]
MDPPSAQLHQEVREAVTRQLEHRRPLLHHLNADSSWLLQIPRPSDVARWFSQQWHRFESACKSIAEVEELAREVEILASSGSRRPGSRRPPNGDTGDDDKQTLIDAVAISHEFTDHCHKETLLQIDRYVPVFASEYAARLIRNWKHFHHVETVPALERDHPDWRAASIPPLPEWLSIARLQEDADNLYYHSALVFSFTITPGPSSAQTTSNRSTRSRRTAALPNGWIPDEGGDQADDDAAECVIYTPHGVRPQALDPIVAASPPLSVLALIHGLHDVAIDAGFWWERNRDKQPLSQLNLGGANGVRVQRVTRAKYWVGTHDEVKWGSGLVNWFLRRKVVSLEEAVRAERERLVEEEEKEEEEKGLLDGVRFEEVGNGESRVLL